MNLLSRNWWHKLTFQQIQKILIENGSNQWQVLSTRQVEDVCLYGLIVNPTFSVSVDQLQQLNVDFEIAYNCDRTGKTTGVIKIDLTFVDLKFTNLPFETLTGLSESNNLYIWIKGTVINFPQITIRVHKWGQKYEDLEISKNIKNKK